MDLVRKRRRRIAALVCLLTLAGLPVMAAIQNWAVVTAPGSKLQDVPLSDLSKMCKGSQKAWPDGKGFVLVIHDPEDPEMRAVIQKLFGVASADVKPLLAKINEARQVVKIVDSDEDLIRTVAATPGAVGLLDVYAINSTVKVLRIDGKLPFDAGYILKGN